MNYESKHSNKKKSHQKYLILFLLILILILYYLFFPKEYLSLAFVKENINSIKNYVNYNYTTSALSYLIIYSLSSALAIPSALILTLSSGILFGLVPGILLTSLGSTLGAVLAFLISRYLFLDLFKSKFRNQYEQMDKEIKKNGNLHLLTLRLVPIFPFWLVNLLMGLSEISLWRYLFISFAGMIPATIVYVYAGLSLSSISELRDVISPSIFFSLLLLSILPYVLRAVVNYYLKKKLYRHYKKPRAFDYNLIIIGGGSAGLVTTFIARILKAKVAIIEKEKMGGDCLNTGCVPSKSLIKIAKIISYGKTPSSWGLKNINIDFSFEDIMNKIHSIIKEIEPHDSIVRYTQLGAECFLGQAQILSPWEVQIGEKIISAKYLVIATGARPIIPQIPGIESISPLTSENIWQLKKQPARLGILGGGVIAAELAQAFSRLGSSVFIIEESSRILSREDEDASGLIHEIFIKEGIKIYTSHTLKKCEKSGDEKILLCIDREGREISLVCDQLFIAIGRKATTSGFGLEKIKLDLNDNGSIKVNEYMQTSLPNIFACGDVAGPFNLTHAASHQAWHTTVNALLGFIKMFKINYSVLPVCTYTDPEIATVGYSKAELIKKSIPFEETIFPMKDLDRAIIEGETCGFVKVFTPPNSDKILGVVIISAEASTMILEFTLAMKHNLGLNKILNTIHAYPGMGEANKYLAGRWKQRKSRLNLLKALERFHTFSRGKLN